MAKATALPHESARAAGLRYVSDRRPGIRRTMSSLGFKYHRPDGRIIRNAVELKRIASLAVPPAWTDVWICPDPRGHLQATGRDARGRKQYRYHPLWRQARDETKYERLPAFAAALPKIRARIDADLARPGLPREKILATIVRLLETSLIRVGNDEYARQNRSFGLTTLRNRHVTVEGSSVKFEFRGKSGVRHSVSVTDKRVARIVRSCRDLPGQELFAYLDEDGTCRDVGSGDVNDYLREISGEDFTAKDFRTWAGTVLAFAAFREMHRQKESAVSAKSVVRVVDAVAGVLGNTRAVCRKSYIHPGIIDACTGNKSAASAARSSRSSSGVRSGLSRVDGRNVSHPAIAGRARNGLSADECAVIAILRSFARQEKRKAA
jgi:DNA topoisomerase-1